MKTVFLNEDGTSPTHYAISMHIVFIFVSTSAVISNLELEETFCQLVPMFETLCDATQQQMQHITTSGCDFFWKLVL
jgi:hypothetical protein